MLTEVGFPVFCVSAFQDTASGDINIIVGGGGGDSKSGVPNALCLYRLQPGHSGLCHKVNQLETVNDAVMSLSSSSSGGHQEDVFAGVGIRTWMVKLVDGKRLILVASVQCDHGGAEDPYVRLVTAGGFKVAAAACDGTVRVWDVASGNRMEEEKVLVFPGDPESVSDILLDDDRLLVVVDHKQLHVYDTLNDYRRVNIDSSSITIPEYVIRCVKRLSVDHYVIVNINRKLRKSIISVHHKQDLTSVTRVTVDKLITAMNCTESLISVGCSDGSVLTFTGDNLHKISSQSPHSFSVTSVAVVDSVVVSGSADGTINVCSIMLLTRHFDGVVLFLLSLIVLLLARLVASREYM